MLATEIRTHILSIPTSPLGHAKYAKVLDESVLSVCSQFRSLPTGRKQLQRKLAQFAEAVPVSTTTSLHKRVVSHAEVFDKSVFQDAMYFDRYLQGTLSLNNNTHKIGQLTDRSSIATGHDQLPPKKSS